MQTEQERGRIEVLYLCKRVGILSALDELVLNVLGLKVSCGVCDCITVQLGGDGLGAGLGA